MDDVKSVKITIVARGDRYPLAPRNSRPLAAWVAKFMGRSGPRSTVENYFLNSPQAALHYRCNLATRYLWRALENREREIETCTPCTFRAPRILHVAVIKKPPPPLGRWAWQAKLMLRLSVRPIAKRNTYLISGSYYPSIQQCATVGEQRRV